jgi:hypothetical protein
MSIFPRSIWLLFAALAGLLGLQALVPNLARRDTPPPAAAAVAVDFVGSSTIELSHVNATDASATVLVRNDSGRDADVKFEGTLLDRLGRPLGTFTQTETLKSVVTPVTLRLAPSSAFNTSRDDRLPARGVVVMTAAPGGATGVAPAIKSRDLVLLQIQPSAAERSIARVGLVAAAIVLAFGLVVSFGAKANPRLEGVPEWTPQSWSTNLAIGGALLTMVLGIAALPAQTHYAARAAYATLSTFFATLVALAPAVYGLLKVGAPSPPGALRLFALAAAVTVWATIGQLGITGLLFLELGMARVISWTSARAAAFLFATVALLVFVYALRAVHAYRTGGGPAPAGPPPPPGAPQRWPLL